MHVRCSYEHLTCHPSTNPAAPAPLPSGRSSTTAGRISYFFTIPKVLRGIFRKRRDLLTHLFHTAVTTLRETFRTRLGLPDGRIGAIAGVHTLPEEWIPDDEPDLNWFNQTRKPEEPAPEDYDQSPAWKPPEIPLGDGRTLVLE